MGVANGSTIIAAQKGYRLLFAAGFSAYPSLYKRLCEVVPSSTSIEQHILAGGLPAIREWVGERGDGSLKLYLQTLRNKTWENTISIPRETFEDDQLGSFNSVFRRMGEQAAMHPDLLLAELLESGFDDDGYDEVEFFSDAHPSFGRGVAARSNKITPALDADGFEEAFDLLVAMKDDQGSPVNVMAGRKPLLIVPPALRSTAKGIVGVERLASGADNPNYDAAEIVVFPHLTSTVKWYLSAGDGSAVKPFIHQVRRAAKVVVKGGVRDDETSWEENAVKFGMDGRWTSGYGSWESIVGSTGLT